MSCTTPAAPFRHLSPVTGPQPYTELTRDMESLAVLYSATDSQTYLALGQYLEPDSLREPESKSILQAARQIAAQGTQLSAPVVLAQVYQRVYSRQLTPEQYAEHEGWVARTQELARTTQADAVVSTCAPLLKRRLRTSLAQRLVSANVAGDESQCDQISDQLARVSLIGQPAAHSWAGLGPDCWQLFAQLRRTERLVTGVYDLDDAIGGGVPIGTITTWGAATGVGKSAAMLTQMIANLRLGRRCIYLTSEMGVPQCLLRAVGILTGHTQGDISRGSPKAIAALDRVLADPLLGAFAIAYLPSGSTVQQLEATLDDLQRRDPRFAAGWDACWVDYGDLMAGARTDRNSYEEAKTVWRGLRRLAEATDGHPARWMITASQLKAPSDCNGSAGDLADSKHKGQISDAVFLIGVPDDSPEQRTLRAAKVRDERSGFSVGPFDTDLACGRFVAERSVTWDQ